MLMVSLFCSLCTVQSILTLQWYVKSQNWSFASYTSSDIKWKQFINTSFYALCVPARHTFVPDGEERERERTSLLLFLQQAPLLAFHPATWAPLLWPGSYFSSGNHLLKTDFRKPCCPATAFPINQAAEMPPLQSDPAADTEYPLPSRLSADIHTLNLQWKHAHANTNISISTHLPPHLVCSRCHCRCPWAGSRCRSPGWECCCYSRDYTARGGNWEKKRLRLGCSNLLGNYYTKERKFSSN